MDLIFQHPRTKGKIYQAGAQEIPGTPVDFYTSNTAPKLISEALKSQQIDLLVLSAEEYQPELPTNKKTTVIYAPMDDNFEPTTQELKEILEVSLPASEIVAEAVLAGKTCLVTCYLGLNRSGLITGLTLLRLTSGSAKQVIKHIRTKRKLRNSLALGNPAFCGIINYLSFLRI